MGPHAAESGQFDLIIEPGKGYRQYWRDLLTYRELFYFLSWRDILVRYKQTAIGVAWAVLRPLLTMVVFTVIFGMLAHFPSEGVPYPILVYTAMLPWQLFSSSLTETSSSLINNAPMLTKVYFPRVILPIAGILSPLLDFVVSLSLLVIMMIFYGIAPTWNILLFPVIILLAIATSLGVGLWFSALNVKYRDFGYTIPFLIQIWLFASPVVYPSTMIPTQYLWLYGLNPMTGVVEGSRWALLGTAPPSLMIFVSVIVVIAILISGMIYFRKMEQYFADIV